MKKNIELKSITDGIDVIKQSADRKWGTDYLRLKVSNDTRFKWDAQVERYNQAVQEQHLPSVRVHAKSMTAGYAALEREADKLGHKPMPPTIWTSKGGPRKTTIHIVREFEHVKQVENSGAATFTIEELIKMIPSGVIALKLQFTGSELKKWEKVTFYDDEIPF